MRFTVADVFWSLDILALRGLGYTGGFTCLASWAGGWLSGTGASSATSLVACSASWVGGLSEVGVGGRPGQGQVFERSLQRCAMRWLVADD